MVKNAIKVYARLKPEKNRKAVVNYAVHHRPKEDLEEDFLILVSPAQKTRDGPDNRPESWNYSFFRVFEESATQADIFESVARPVMESALEGYNGTIFAYGQTASGKTHTIVGSQVNSDSRGIIPRCLQYVFDAIQKRPENLYTVEVAFLEIYNENGYDLLDRRQREYAVTRLEDLPRVSIQEDESGQLHLKNLSFHGVESFENAFQLLLVGENNRVTSETPMNPQSSRSHCIFTIVVSMKEFGADHYKRAKVHLVDLAGSERVYKCSISGTILTEAKHINLSLHYLEQVIVCLGQESVGHIPYRNSYLTSILRDSLGGNCMTAMLANLSTVSSNIEETISACRFAQRVAMINNDVKLVLHTSVRSENALLKLENERLKKQIEAMTKGISSEELTAEDKWKLDAQIRNFIEFNAKISWNYSLQSVEYCFESFRRILELSKDPKSCSMKLEYYKDLVFQRDKEISLLIDLLNKGKEKRQFSVKEGSLKESKLPGDKHLILPDEAGSLTNNPDELTSNVETSDYDGRSGMQLVDHANNGNRPTTVSESRTTCTEDNKTNAADSSSAMTSVLDDKISINSVRSRNHKKKFKDYTPVLTCDFNDNSRNTVVNESKNNCNKNGVNDRPNFLANNIANVRNRKKSLELISANKHVSVNNIQPELLSCNIVNVTLGDSTVNKNPEEQRQVARKAEKKQARNGEIKNSTIKNAETTLLSESTVNQESDGKARGKNVNDSVVSDDDPILFYEKMLRFNGPQSETKSPLTSDLSTIESQYSNNIMQSLDAKLRSRTQNYDLKLRHKFLTNCDLLREHRPTASTQDFNFDNKFENDDGNRSVSVSSSRGSFQNDRFVDNASSQRFVEPLVATNVRDEEKDEIARYGRSSVYFSNREIESNASKRSGGRKSSVGSFTADRQEKSSASARSKTNDDFHQKLDRGRGNGSFEDSLPLTGDPEIDEEIIAFYEAKRLGGVY
nr:kinesin-like protein KIF9 [Megalopta genalis]